MTGNGNKQEAGGGGVEQRRSSFNGLFCIQVVAGGFWKPQHTVYISPVKGQTQQQLQLLTTYLITLTIFRDNPRLL